MTETISLPLWLAAGVFLLAAIALLERFVLPSVRWVIRRRVARVLDEVDARLHIHIQPFKLTKRQVLIDRLLADSSVGEALEATAREEGLSRDRVFARAATYAEEIVPAFNAYVYFRVGYSIARQVAKALYRVRLGATSEQALSAVPANVTVVFLMNHRSNMDYVLVSYLVAEKTALSYAVGEWARVFPLQTLFRAMGAYFIRRDSKNPLYRRVLERYVAMATAEGVTQAVYPEGGLTRDGRLRPPRLGILDYMLRGFDPKTSKDIVFVPVGLNYDRTLEDRTLLLERDGPKPAGGAGKAALRTGAFVLNNLVLLVKNEWRRFGYACVNLGDPISLKAWLAPRGADPHALSKDERMALVASLAQDLMAGIAKVVPVLPVPLVATVFVAQPERAFTEIELKAEVMSLVARFEAKGARVHVPRRDRDYAFTVGLRLLTSRHAVLVEDGLYRASSAELHLLRYYAASIEHLQ